VRARASCNEGGHAVAKLSASSSLEDGDDLDRRAPFVSERKKGREEGASGGLAGPRKEASRLGQLDCTVGRERKGERPAGLGHVEEKEKEKKEDGPGEEEKKRERKRNAFEFEFEI
jgi:hypothetical protein